MSSKQKQRIHDRRSRVQTHQQTNTLPVDDFVYKMAKKEGVSKVTIYADLKYLGLTNKAIKNETI